MPETAQNSLNLHAIIDLFDPIHLNAMDNVSLMDRIDTKFIFHRQQLVSILEKVLGHYTVLEIDGNRVMGYKNQYFDTKNKQFYTDHHNGKGNRMKIRIRAYTDSKRYYLEVKQKSNKGRTKKLRKSISDFQTMLSQEAMEFVKPHIGSDALLFPMLQNTFQRITLVNILTGERATFDTDICFNNDAQEHSMNNLVVAELKQANFNRGSLLFRVLKKEAIHPYRISKYCMGLLSLSDDVKYNLFKEKLLRINKITAA